MGNKKHTRFEKGTAIKEMTNSSKWCCVNTENEFIFMGQTFVIPENNENYKVINKASEIEDYTNEAYMEEILVVVDNNHSIWFYDQNFDFVENVVVRIKK